MLFTKKKYSPISSFCKNDSPKFENIKLFNLKNHQDYIESIYKIIVNLNNFKNTSIKFLWFAY